MISVKQTLIVLVLGASNILYSQNTTRSQSKTAEREAPASHKILLVPFEPKLYNSEIDRNINAETGLSSKEIKYKFRDGLNEQLYKAFRASKYNAIDLMDDTAKTKKDLDGIYQYLIYEYLKVPDQANYRIPEKEKSEKKIEKGQLMVETNSDQRFMDARIISPKVIPALQGKYKTNVFLFINQLDIFASGNKGQSDPGMGSAYRKIIVHYTIYDTSGKEINSGTVEESLEPDMNVPRKIVDKHFSRIAVALVTRTNKALGLTSSR